MPRPKIVTRTERTQRFPSEARKRRQILFDHAGISLEDEANLLKEAFNQNLANLKAEKVEVRVLDDGSVVTVPVPDNQIRQRAVESAYDMVGAKQNTKGDGTDGGPTLTLVLPDYYSQEFLANERRTINVTPEPIALDNASDDIQRLDVSRNDGREGVEGDEGDRHLRPVDISIESTSRDTEFVEPVSGASV